MYIITSNVLLKLTCLTLNLKESMCNLCVRTLVTYVSGLYTRERAENPGSPRWVTPTQPDSRVGARHPTRGGFSLPCPSGCPKHRSPHGCPLEHETYRSTTSHGLETGENKGMMWRNGVPLSFTHANSRNPCRIDVHAKISLVGFSTKTGHHGGGGPLQARFVAARHCRAIQDVTSPSHHSV